MPLRKLVWADPDFGPGLAGLAHSQQAGPLQGTWARLGLDWPTVSRPGHHRGLGPGLAGLAHSQQAGPLQGTRMCRPCHAWIFWCMLLSILNLACKQILLQHPSQRFSASQWDFWRPWNIRWGDRTLCVCVCEEFDVVGVGNDDDDDDDVDDDVQCKADSRNRRRGGLLCDRQQSVADVETARGTAQ